MLSYRRENKHSISSQLLFQEQQQSKEIFEPLKSDVAKIDNKASQHFLNEFMPKLDEKIFKNTDEIKSLGLSEEDVNEIASYYKWFLNKRNSQKDK